MPTKRLPNVLKNSMEKECIDHTGNYSLNTVCSNCDHEGKTWLRKGTFVHDEKCPKCGCKTLAKITTPYKPNFTM